MARVDPSDDSVPRWVVSHYRYDPDRREKTWIDLAAFDGQDEFEAYIREIAAAGTIKVGEHLQGGFREAGYRDRMNRQRIERETFIRRARVNPSKKPPP